MFVADWLSLLLDRLDQIRGQRPSQAARIDAGQFDGGDQRARRPAVVMAPSPDAEAVGEYESKVVVSTGVDRLGLTGGVALGRRSTRRTWALICGLARGQSILLEDAPV